MKNLVAVLCVAIIFSSLARAQVMRTWVSSTGSDHNPCTRTAPCQDFVGAPAKTAAGGEINCVDAGDYGTVTITQAITIDCGGTFGSVFAGQIIINAGSSDIVTIRNLSINGGGQGGGVGINYLGARAVHLRNVRINGFGTPSINGFGLNVAATGTVLLTVDNMTISECSVGISIGSTGPAIVSINHTRIFNTIFGVEASSSSRVTIRDSTIYSNKIGVIQETFAPLGSTLTVVSTTLGYSTSTSAALQSFTGQFILAFGNTFVNNVLDFNPNGGMIFTGSDNNNSGSPPGTANGGVVPKI